MSPAVAQGSSRIRLRAAPRPEGPSGLFCRERSPAPQGGRTVTGLPVAFPAGTVAAVGSNWRADLPADGGESQ
jgi:hypothetical protein